MAFKVGTAGKIFRALADQSINIEMIATSEIRTSCIVLEKDCDKAVNAIHNHFEFCLLYTSPSPRDVHLSRMPSSA